MAKTNGLDKLTYKELLELQTQVANAIVERKVSAKADFKRKIAEMAAESGFDLAELGVTKSSSRKGSKVEAKYRNPANPSETWAGRGRQPKWIAAALKKGQKLENFAI